MTDTATTAEDRDATIAAIKHALRARSGKAWSVKGGRGTSWGWITIIAPPARCNQFGSMSPEDAAELAGLLGLDAAVHHQGVSIPASRAYRREYLDRAAGRTPTALATPYWD